MHLIQRQMVGELFAQREQCGKMAKWLRWHIEMRFCCRSSCLRPLQQRVQLVFDTTQTL